MRIDSTAQAQVVCDRIGAFLYNKKLTRQRIVVAEPFPLYKGSHGGTL